MVHHILHRRYVPWCKPVSSKIENEIITNSRSRKKNRWSSKLCLKWFFWTLRRRWSYIQMDDDTAAEPSSLESAKSPGRGKDFWATLLGVKARCPPVAIPESVNDLLSFSILISWSRRLDLITQNEKPVLVASLSFLMSGPAAFSSERLLFLELKFSPEVFPFWGQVGCTCSIPISPRSLTIIGSCTSGSSALGTTSRFCNS